MSSIRETPDAPSVTHSGERLPVASVREEQVWRPLFQRPKYRQPGRLARFLADAGRVCVHPGHQVRPADHNAGPWPREGRLVRVGDAQIDW